VRAEGCARATRRVGTRARADVAKKRARETDAIERAKMGRAGAARAAMDDERASKLRAAANAFAVDRAREEAARSGAREDAMRRATTVVRRHRAGVDDGRATRESESEEEDEDALGFARTRTERETTTTTTTTTTGRARARASSSASDASSSESEDEEARDARRAAIRARAAARETERAEDDDEEDAEDGGAGGAVAVARRDGALATGEPGNGGASSSSYETDSEYETDSDASDSGGGGARKMFKPVFVRKIERDTIEERDKMLAELDAEAAKTEAAKAAKKAESKKLVEVEVKREEALAAAMDEMEPSDVDTDDELDDALEFDAWKSRELERLKTDRIQRELIFREREEQERIRSMTEEERDLYHAKRLAKRAEQEKEKPKMAFMQKYYHKGAFFQESADDAFGTAGPDEIYKRDFSAPTAEEKFDKSILPAAMQVRKGKFGRAGQTKWTHLAAEDTSAARKGDDDDLWSGRDKSVRAIKDKMLAKQGGLRDAARRA
jgi:microfibrillar-associated protein 1